MNGVLKAAQFEHIDLQMSRIQLPITSHDITKFFFRADEEPPTAG